MNKINLNTWQFIQIKTKYFFEPFLALILLILLLPLFFVIALMIYVDDGLPIFFMQERVGLNGKIFKMYKFRTFKVNQENKDIHTYKSDPRITRVGKYLREFSLDELPQLINIILGDMSFIGPRPMLPEQHQKLSDLQKQRVVVKPGITGLAQINGRNSISWDKRIEFDIKYIHDYSILLDLYIFFKTFFIIFKREGVWEK